MGYGLCVHIHNSIIGIKIEQKGIKIDIHINYINEKWGANSKGAPLLRVYSSLVANCSKRHRWAITLTLCPKSRFIRNMLHLLRIKAKSWDGKPWKKCLLDFPLLPLSMHVHVMSHPHISVWSKPEGASAHAACMQQLNWLHLPECAFKYLRIFLTKAFLVIVWIVTDNFKVILTPSMIKYACPNHTDDGIHSDHGYLDICNNPLGPP